MPIRSETREILLLGAGHSHVQVLQRLSMNRPANAAVTLVTDRALAPYSGMLPGCVAGDYQPDDIHIDAVKLARAAGATLILGKARGIDLNKRQVLLADRPPLPYDILSVNTGITPDLSALPGAAEHALAVKPIARLLTKLNVREQRLKQLGRALSCVIVGGGPAGFEMALALKDRWAASGVAVASITLLVGDALLPQLNGRARGHAADALARAGIHCVMVRATRVDADSVQLSNGDQLPSDITLVATAARVPEWLQASGFALAQNGGIAIGPTLQTLNDARIFAAGDCATLVDDPRPRAGVFAVRQGPVLAENLLRLIDAHPLKTYHPQRNFLTLLRINRDAHGHTRAIASRGRWLAGEGRWLWTLKNRIDRDFMAMFTPAAIGPDDAPEMLCRGCAAKVGPQALHAALESLPPVPSPLTSRLPAMARDDAALIAMPDAGKLLATIDMIPALISDPFRFGQIVAVHALNDIFAMGGSPHHAMALAAVPDGSNQTMLLTQMLAGVRAVLDAEEVVLAGGHSSTAAEVALGLAVTGMPGERTLSKGGARAGDHLILTKPLGTGILLAAEMRMAAKGEAMSGVLEMMTRSNGAASRILVAHGATAMTDVTGFGFAGHLAEMLKASSPPLSADLQVATVPVMPEAKRLALAGYHSTALAANRGQIDVSMKDSSTPPFWLEALLLDPQTAGGLMAAVPASQSTAALQALRTAGYEQAAVIGALTAATDNRSRLKLID